ncbi:MAG: ABC transporter permease [Chloroflexi bacterium]|nr:ABC transporter permease [Chloroflexota bacterium]
MKRLDGFNVQEREDASSISETNDKLPGKWVLNIHPSKGYVPINLRDLWNYRELLYFLIWRDIKVRYKQTALGVVWAILQPFLTMVAFSIFLGHLAGVPSEGVPYPIFTFTALLPWQLFAQAFIHSGNSLVANQHLITKVYFPRLVIPIAAVLGGLVDFAIAFVVLLGMLIYFGIMPTVAILTLPLFILLALATALAVGLWLSALNVEYRDVRHLTPFLVQFWLFVTPVAYPSSLIPKEWQVWYSLNPMTGVIEGFRMALLGKTEWLSSSILVSTIVVALLLISGLAYFRRMEKTFADVV